MHVEIAGWEHVLIEPPSQPRDTIRCVRVPLDRAMVQILGLPEDVTQAEADKIARVVHAYAWMPANTGAQQPPLPDSQ